MLGMQAYSFALAWLLNVLIMSFVLAVFEILMEKRCGWGSGLNPSGWGAKLLEGSILAHICEKPYFTAYHVFMFGVVIPAGLLAECVAVRLVGIGHAAYSTTL